MLSKSDSVTLSETCSHEFRIWSEHQAVEAVRRYAAVTALCADLDVNVELTHENSTTLESEKVIRQDILDTMAEQITAVDQVAAAGMSSGMVSATAIVTSDSVWNAETIPSGNWT
jgi:hypothetical protein